MNASIQRFEYSGVAEVTSTTEADTYPVAITQTHHSREGRAILHEFTLEEFKEDPNELIKERYEEIESFSALAWENGKEEAEAEKKTEARRRV